MISVYRYHPVLVALHWILAFFIIAALYLGATKLAPLPATDPGKIEGLRIHMTGGIVLLTLMLLRLAARNVTTLPPKASAGHPFLDALARISHWALYGAVIAMAAMGVMLAVESGLIGLVFGKTVSVPADLWVYWPRTAHYVISRVLMALIALHISGALFHTFVLKDGLLRRMLFGRRKLGDGTGSG